MPRKRNKRQNPPKKVQNPREYDTFYDLEAVNPANPLGKQQVGKMYQGNYTYHPTRGFRRICDARMGTAMMDYMRVFGATP